MAKQRIRLGLVGVGNNAANHHLPAYRNLPGVEVAACCATSLDRARAAAGRLGIPAAYADVGAMVREARLDAVCVCSPNDAHHRNVLDALAAGAHVLCEKPMALDASQAGEMCKAAREAGRVAMVAFTYRFVPAAILAKTLIARGELGEVFTVQATYISAYLADLDTPVAKPWKLRRARGNGVLGDLGSHLIDLTRWWLGEILRVAGSTHRVVPERQLAGGGTFQVDADDACAFTAEFASGAVGSYFVTKYATGHANHQRIEVYGQRGALAYSVERPESLAVCIGPEARGAHRWTALEAPPPSGGEDRIEGLDGYRLEQARAFVRAIRGELPPAPTFCDGLACQRALDAVAMAAAKATAVDVERESGAG